MCQHTEGQPDQQGSYCLVGRCCRVQELRIGADRETRQKAINSQLGRAENTRFIEHFRYVLIASQLINEYQDHGSLQPSRIPAQTPEIRTPNVASFLGAAVTAGFAFLLVWLLHWARNTKTTGPRKSRLLLTALCYAAVAVIVYAYARRQWLKYIRKQAVENATRLTTDLQAFELSSTSALSLIQEIELVSKGYRISTPLPPVSRLEDSKPGRRCAMLRRRLSRIYSALVPAFKSGLETLRGLHNEDDFDKFLDIYDVSHESIQEASSDLPLEHGEDAESLGALRVLSYKYSTLRRALLCSLLSLEADGGSPDFARWRTAIEIMDNLCQLTSTHSSNLNNSLKEIQDFSTPAMSRFPVKPSSDRLRTQVRKISTLSTGIRTLQAKMALLREESNKAISESEDLTDLGPNLMAQYESIGADLRSLMQAWETGKAALANNIDKHERRISMASSGLRSPISLGGLTAVGEESDSTSATSSGGPADALRALMGETLSDRSSLPTTPGSEGEEVFEAIAMPRVRQRPSLSRDERIRNMREEREKQEVLREKRASSTNMIRELQTVISLREPRKRMDRMTSI